MSTYILRKGVARMSDLIEDGGQFPVPPLFVDTVLGAAGNDGGTWDTAMATMTAALAIVATSGTIFFRGSIAECCVGSNLKFDVSIIGVGSKHHADVPAAGYHPGAAAWVGAGTALTPLMKVRGRGWKFKNIMFDCPADAAGIYLERNALSDVSEYDASHATIESCDFRNGKYAIQDVGGVWNVRVEDCDFETFDATGGCAIINTSTAVAAPRRWIILNNRFQMDSSTEGNLQHIDSPLNGSTIIGNVFGTVKSTAIYIDLTGGASNVVCDNYMAGDYAVADYVAAAGDIWYGNHCAVDASTAPVAYSILPPD